MKPLEKKRARELYAQGVPRPKIAAELGASCSAVIGWTRDMGVPKKPCPVCNKRFQPKRTNQRYCSPKCSKRHEYQAPKPSLPSARICEGCNKSFKPRHRGHRYCTFKCRDKARSKRYYEMHKTTQGGV